MSPLEIWCNEAQERYVLALAPGTLPLSPRIAQRERCPFAVVGEITEDGRAAGRATRCFAATPVDMPIEVLLGKPPRMRRDVRAACQRGYGPSTRGVD